MNIFWIVINSCNGKAEISESFRKPLLQSSYSHNHSEIILICWFTAQKFILIIIHVSKDFNIFLRILWWTESSKEWHLFEIHCYKKSKSLLSLLINLMCPCWIKVLHLKYIYIYIYFFFTDTICVCVCVCVYIYIYIKYVLLYYCLYKNKWNP